MTTYNDNNLPLEGLKADKYYQMQEECPERLSAMSNEEFEEWTDLLLHNMGQRIVDLHPSCQKAAGCRDEMRTNGQMGLWWDLNESAHHMAEEIALQEFFQA